LNVTIFFHHVGEVGAARDFPRTIFDDATPSGMRLFKGEDILPELTDLPEAEIFRIGAAARSAPKGFQIWGIPSGGLRVFRRINENDHWLLLDTDRPGGTISYAGKVICKLENPSFRLSSFLWGEAKFPLILLLDGFRTELEITQFKELFGYKPKWDMRGFSYSLATTRIKESIFQEEVAFIEHLSASRHAGTRLLVFEEPPPDEYVMEGDIALVAHLMRERDRTLIAKFKASLKSFECCVCGFDFAQTYGDLGAEFIEAHHIKPLSEGGRRETRISDLRGVCSNCHRMLHRALGISIEDLSRILRKNKR
jgi:hypothetical protein